MLWFSTPIRKLCFLSRGKNTPFDGKRYFGEIELTLVGGKTAYQAE